MNQIYTYTEEIPYVWVSAETYQFLQEISTHTFFKPSQFDKSIVHPTKTVGGPKKRGGRRPYWQIVRFLLDARIIERYNNCQMYKIIDKPRLLKFIARAGDVLEKD